MSDGLNIDNGMYIFRCARSVYFQGYRIYVSVLLYKTYN